MAAFPQEITQLLLNWSQGDEAALEQLIPLVYPELRKMARRYMGREKPDHTLQTSALINEAYLRLVDQQAVQWQDRGHFFAVAARVMRHILVDHARSRKYAKRGAGAEHVQLDEVNVDEIARINNERAAEFVGLDDALTNLAQVDPRQSQIVELRFFGGLTVDETAEVLELSPITIKREWRTARAWLQRQMANVADPEPDK